MRLTRQQLPILFVASATLWLSACNSPLKYKPRDQVNNERAEVKTAKQTQQCEGSYQVRSGDTLSEIAVKCDIDMTKLAKYNQLLPPYIIYVNQELLIPSAQALETSPELVDTNDTVESDKSDESEKTSAVVKSIAAAKDLKPKTETPRQTKPSASAKAIERRESPQEQVKLVKSGPWQWPMNKGLEHRYVRDRSGLSVLDIYGVPGQDVKAVTSGKVVYAGNGIANFGWMLVIKHTNEYMSIYAHNSALLVKEGDIVRGGQVVATMGATGNTKRPKLYLEARYQGRKVDIKKLLKP